MRIKNINHAGTFLKEADSVKDLFQDILGLPVTYVKVNPETVPNCFLGVGDTEVDRVTYTVEEGPISKMMKYFPSTGITHAQSRLPLAQMHSSPTHSVSPPVPETGTPLHELPRFF